MSTSGKEKMCFGSDTSAAGFYSSILPCEACERILTGHWRELVTKDQEE